MRNLWVRRASCFTVVLALIAAAAYSAPITVPSGLNPGDQYRLAFATSTTRDATSADINVYNDFVTAEAESVRELLALSTTWTAIASTSAVDARDNTNTNPNNAVGVPIYLLNNTVLANDNADLWDRSIDNRFIIGHKNHWGKARLSDLFTREARGGIIDIEAKESPC